MRVAEVKQIAQARGIEKPRGRKESIIREIQAAEGFSSCFSTGISTVCSQSRCLWRHECI